MLEPGDRDPSASPSADTVSLAPPTSRAAGRCFLALRRLAAWTTACRRRDEALLRALAAIDDDRISELSEEGRALRRAARRRFHLHP